MVLAKQQNSVVHKAAVKYVVDIVYNDRPIPRGSAILAAGESFADDIALTGEHVDELRQCYATAFAHKVGLILDLLCEREPARVMRS